MADSVQMIAEMVTYLDTLPKTPNGDAKVEDPTAVAVAFIGIAAPLYQADIDAIDTARATAESLSSSRNEELIGLRADYDNLVRLVAAVEGAAEVDDIAAVKAALAAR